MADFWASGAIEAGPDLAVPPSDGSVVVLPSTEGWYPDPLAPTARRGFLRRRPPARSRWWNGTTWTTKISVRNVEGLSWTPELLQLVGPTTAPSTAIAPPTAVEPPIETQVEQVAPSIEVTAPAVPLIVVMTAGAKPVDPNIDPLVAAFGPTVALADAPSVPHHRLRRGAAAVLLAASLGAVVAGSSAAVINQDRPQVSSATTYSDLAAGFTLQYPAGWRVQSKVPNSTIRFTIGARDAVLSQTNTVSVLMSSKPTPLGNLDALASQVPGGLRSQFPGVRLQAAEQTKLLGGPAFHLRLTVSDEVPAIRIEQYVGTTTSGRTLTVTVTVREPRTAPTPSQIREFLDSIEST